jgi:hypothetical protein
MAMKATTTNPEGTIFNSLTQCVAYTDDVVIMGGNINALKRTFIEFRKEAERFGLAVNMQKINI